MNNSPSGGSGGEMLHLFGQVGLVLLLLVKPDSGLHDAREVNNGTVLPRYREEKVIAEGLAAGILRTKLTCQGVQ